MIRSLAESIWSAPACTGPAAVPAGNPDRARALFVLFASIVVGVNLTLFASLLPAGALDTTLIQRPLTAATAAMAVSLIAFVGAHFQCGHPGLRRAAGAAWFVALALAFGAAADPATAATASVAEIDSLRPAWRWAPAGANLLTCLYLADLAWRYRRHGNPGPDNCNRRILPPLVGLHALSQGYLVLVEASATGALIAQTLPFTLFGVAFTYGLLRDGGLKAGKLTPPVAVPAGALRAPLPRSSVSITGKPHWPGQEPGRPNATASATPVPPTLGRPDPMFLRIVAATPYGLVVVDPSGRIAYWNPSASRLFGYSDEALLGKPVHALVPARLAAGFRATIARTRQQDPTCPSADHEIVGLTASGHEIPLAMRLDRLGGADEGTLLLSVREGAEQIQAEQRLRREIGFLRQVIDLTPNLLYVRDGAGRFVLANQALADLYGTTVEALIGRRAEDFDDNAQAVGNSLRTDRETLATLREHVIEEEYVTDAGGHGRWLRTTKRPLIGRGEHDHLVLCSSVEITTYRQTAHELVLQREALAHLSRVTMLGELSGSLAHELNQPLAAILANAQAAQQFLAEEFPDLEEIKDILQDIVADDKRAGNVIQGLRALLKKGEFRKEPVDLNEVVREVLRLLQSELLNAGIQVNLSLASDLPPVLGDRVHLQQVLINLLVNAIEAMSETPAARRRIQVDTHVQQDASVELRVSDSGPGIAADQRECVFEPFATTKPNGLGMGLAICRTIICANRGKLWVVPDTADGATFCFSLPASVSQRT